MHAHVHVGQPAHDGAHVDRVAPEPVDEAGEAAAPRDRLAAGHGLADHPMRLDQEPRGRDLALADRIFGLAGNDVLDGGAGIDTACFGDDSVVATSRPAAPTAALSAAATAPTNSSGGPPTGSPTATRTTARPRRPGARPPQSYGVQRTSRWKPFYRL